MRNFILGIIITLLVLVLGGLAVANFGSDTVSLFLGNGNGTFGAAQNLIVGDGPEAKAVADGSIKAAAVRGLQSWTVSVSGSRVTVTGTLSVQLMVLGNAALSESRSAIFAYGQ